LQRTFKYASGRLTNSPAWQEVAPYSSRRHSQDFGAPAERDFAKLNLHLPAYQSLGAGRGIFDQPAKKDFFNRL
jgi:hypothetical protein